jgi:predicted DNA-binding transcriptional regulator AlpA
MSQLMTEDELAKELKVSRSFLWALRKRGLPVLRLGKKSVRYEFQAVLDWIANNVQEKAPAVAEQEGDES